MEEKFEKWAEEKAYKWMEGFRKLRNEGKFLDDKGLRYVLMKELLELGMPMVKIMLKSKIKWESI